MLTSRDDKLESLFRPQQDPLIQWWNASLAKLTILLVYCLFEILQKKNSSEVDNMVRTEMYLINTCNPKEVKIRKQIAKDDVQFNFILSEGVFSSCTPLRNTGKSMVVDFERTDQFSPKSHALFKPSKGLPYRC